MHSCCSRALLACRGLCGHLEAALLLAFTESSFANELTLHARTTRSLNAATQSHQSFVDEESRTNSPSVRQQRQAEIRK